MRCAVAEFRKDGDGARSTCRLQIEIAERAVLNENPGAVQIIAKVAGCSWATAKALLLMRVAERKMSKMDLKRARANFEHLERRTAQRVLKFYEARRNMLAHAGATITASETAKLEAMIGVGADLVRLPDL